MKSLSLWATVLALGLALTTADAEAAKRLGSGSSSGMQRQLNIPNKAPAMAPAQAPTASAAAKSPATAAATSQGQAKRSWLGPLAGLAAGLGLAALASYLGFGEELASMMMIALVVMTVLIVVGLIMRRRASAQQPAMAGAREGAMQYEYAATASASATALRKTPDPAMPRSGDVAAPKGANPYDAEPVSSPDIPADFDVAGFVRQAKVNFIRLQAANDGGNLDDLREFTTPEMFAELKTTILGRGDAIQETDVLEINAEVLEIVEEGSRYVLSVRYSGLIREDKDAAAEAINEIWHLVKPRHGNSGWLLAGIQQTQ